MKMGKIEKSLILDSYIRRRKSNTNTEICEKKKKQEAFRRVSIILRKCEQSRTPEETHLLESGSDIVKQILIRKDRIQQIKERILEKEDPYETIDKKAQKLADVISRARHLVCYTGAGISTSARIPDYRGSQGIWTLLQQGKDIGQHDLSLADPTFTHMALYELHRRNILRYVLSQNCDGLHLRSGLPRKSLSEVHGNMYIEVCKSCKPNTEYWRLFDTTEQTARFYHKTNRRCHVCSKPLVDTIVHFGERGNLKWPLNWDGACRHAEKADVILCLGSSLKVLKKYPWLWAMDRPKNKRPKIYIVNLQWTPKDAVADLKINGKCDEVMELVMKYMKIKVSKYTRLRDPIFAHASLLAPEELHTVSQPMLKTHKESDSSDDYIKTELEVKKEISGCDNDKESNIPNKDHLANINLTNKNDSVDKVTKKLPDLIPINRLGSSDLVANKHLYSLKTQSKNPLHPKDMTDILCSHEQTNPNVPESISGKSNDIEFSKLSPTSMETSNENINDYNEISSDINESPTSCQQKKNIDNDKNQVADTSLSEKANSGNTCCNNKDMNKLPTVSNVQFSNSISKIQSLESNNSSNKDKSKSPGRNCVSTKYVESESEMPPLCYTKEYLGTIHLKQELKTELINLQNNFLNKTTLFAQSFCDNRHLSNNLMSDKLVCKDLICHGKFMSKKMVNNCETDMINSIKDKQIFDDVQLHNGFQLLDENDYYKSILDYCKVIENSLPHWYDVNYAYSGLHSIIHPPPTEVDIWGTIIIPIFQLNRKDAECEFCFDNYAEYNCQFYRMKNTDFMVKNNRNGKTILCECCDFSDVSDLEQCNDNKVDKRAKLELTEYRESVKIQAGWYGKGYRKIIRRKKRT